MAHYKAIIAYDGTEFFGFQRQAIARTVQGEVEAALARLNGGEAVTVRGAGRTDSGVHATGQVIDFHLPRWRHDEAALQRALNATLPMDVALREVTLAAPGFHPRFSATSRRYLYTIYNGATRHPLLQRTTLHESRPLDEGAMDEAVRALLGSHDFASFGRATTPSEITVRELRHARVWREGELVRVELEANAFLYRMVRRIVGCLLVVGRGEQAPAWLAELLAAQDRGQAAAVAAPNGLCLVGVGYAAPSGGSRPWSDETGDVTTES